MRPTTQTLEHFDFFAAIILKCIFIQIAKFAFNIEFLKSFFFLIVAVSIVVIY